MSSTVVTFASGDVTGTATVTRVERSEDDVVVVVDATPFHPVDHTWPDQPGDSGTIGVDDTTVRIADAVMAAVSDEGAFAVGADIPVRRGADGWTWLVGHRIDGAVPAGIVAGASVDLSVDAERRAALSRGHTACHLASLALDLAVAELWRKDPGRDALGNPDFESRANQTSRIDEDGSVDTYRLGKSLRKSGFDTDAFAATLADREARINATLAEWVAARSESRIVVDGQTIVDRRRWQCDLPEGRVEMLCGGTHAPSLASFGAIEVRLDLSDPQLLVMTTRATPAD